MDLHHIRSDIIQLKELSSRLSPSSKEDFLKFAGLYEDILSKLNNISPNEENSSSLRELKKELEECWENS